MARKSPLTPEEVTELFSELDESGVLDPSRVRDRDKRIKARMRLGGHDAADSDGGAIPGDERAHRTIDPLSGDDPSGSKVDHTISRTAVAFLLGIFVLVVGMQIWYGVNRRLNTANLSDAVNTRTVSLALDGGVEWGNGFTQFPQTYSIDAADEQTGVLEVSVVDTTSQNELELFSNSQIQAAALATNALLNDNINEVVYNVSVYMDENGNISHDSVFGLLPATGDEHRLFTFIWSKSTSGQSNIGWDLRIVGLDDEITERIQEQVNSVSSLIEDPGISESDFEAQQRDREREQSLKGDETYRGSSSAGATEE